MIQMNYVKKKKGHNKLQSEPWLLTVLKILAKSLTWPSSLSLCNWCSLFLFSLFHATLFPIFSIWCPSISHMYHAPDCLSAFAQAILSTQSAPIHTLIFGTCEYVTK